MVKHIFPFVSHIAYKAVSALVMTKCGFVNKYHSKCKKKDLT